jgi:hypothetical protein
LHNCIKQAGEKPQIDIESVVVVVKIFNDFSSSAKHTEECRVGTRWLTLYTAIERLVKCWPAVKSYFLSPRGDDCPCQI